MTTERMKHGNNMYGYINMNNKTCEMGDRECHGCQMKVILDQKHVNFLIIYIEKQNKIIHSMFENSYIFDLIINT